MMVDSWTALSRLNADLLVAVARSLEMGWAVLAAGAAWTSRPSLPLDADLRALGLDYMPRSADELRRAYRGAAKLAHPDTGGSAEAFRAVSEAFGRLAGGQVRAP